MSDKSKENNKTQKIRLNSPKNSVKIVNKGNCFCLSLQIASSMSSYQTTKPIVDCYQSPLSTLLPRKIISNFPLGKWAFSMFLAL